MLRHKRGKGKEKGKRKPLNETYNIIKINKKRAKGHELRLTNNKIKSPGIHQRILIQKFVQDHPVTS